MTDKRRQDWNDILLGIASSTNSICSAHFSDDCFDTSKIRVRPRLKSTALPTIFDFQYNFVSVAEYQNSLGENVNLVSYNIITPLSN